MIKEITRAEILEAMDLFDQELRQTEQWFNWEKSKDHRYAIEYNNHRYPVKEIISLATNTPLTEDEEASKYAVNMGFSIVQLSENLNPEANTDLIKNGLETILARYAKARDSEPLKGHKLGSTMDSLKQSLEVSEPVRKRPNLKVTWSIGQGNWAKVPWIAFLDSRETDTTQSGVYCVFLFCQDMSGVYLTYNQGVTKPQKEQGRAGARKLLLDRAKNIRQQFCDKLSQFDFKMDDNIDLRADPGLGADYEDSTIAYKLYKISSVPHDIEILKDLEAVFQAYDQYLESKSSYWIFQANPQIYNISRALTELSEMSWLVLQHAEKIHSGDKVFLWESGSDAGIIALATVLTNPTYLPEDEKEKKYALDEEKFKGSQRRVRLRIECVLSERIRREALLNHPVLSTLTILKAPQGTNFALTAEQAKALTDLISVKPIPKCNPATTVDEILELIKNKKQVILYGPPETGKTYKTKTLAIKLLLS